MRIIYRRGYDIEGHKARLVVGDNFVDFVPNPANFKAALKALGVELVYDQARPERGPVVYNAANQTHYVPYTFCGHEFEISISDRDRSLYGDVPESERLGEIVDGCNPKNAVEEGAGGEDTGRDNQVPETA